jgi:hypothetical protein
MRAAWCKEESTGSRTPNVAPTRVAPRNAAFANALGRLEIRRVLSGFRSNPRCAPEKHL